VETIAEVATIDLLRVVAELSSNRSEPFCTIFPQEIGQSINSSRGWFVRQTRRLTCLLEARTCPDKVVRGSLPDVHQPESTTVSPSSGGTPSRAGSVPRLREEERNAPGRSIEVRSV
jgi:hypothetical protein